MAEFARKKRALAPEPLARLDMGLLGSPFVGESPLGGTFGSSRGFAFIFRRDGQSELELRFPFLVPYLRAALAPELHRRLLGLRERLRGLQPAEANAFYLNLLLLRPGDAVGRHVDATLRDVSGVHGALPLRVFVLYLRVPPASGGQLFLYRHRLQVGRVQPRQGEACIFRGELAHEVRPFASGAPQALRASLVLEQYRLPADGLARVPALKICSRAGFSAYLKGGRRDEPIPR